MFNSIKKLSFIAPFYIFIGYLIFGLLILILLILVFDEKNLAAFSILLASQVAGFAVLSTILNTNKIENEKKESEKIKTQKVLSSYFRHLIVLAEEQRKYFNMLEKSINEHHDIHLKEIGIIESSFEDELNTIAFVNPIESMLNPDLHKYSDEEILNHILTIKTKVLEMIHLMKIIKVSVVPRNDRTQVLDILTHMKDETATIITNCEKYTS